MTRRRHPASCAREKGPLACPRGSDLAPPAGEPKAIDFGIARATDSDIAITTQTDVGQLVGTMQYMSPEQCDADPHDIDTRSDVYALGVLLYELLSGELPYETTGTTIYEATRRIKEDAPRQLSAIKPKLRGDVETIVFKALEKDRDHRYASAAGLAEDIERHLRGEPIAARPLAPRGTLGGPTSDHHDRRGMTTLTPCPQDVGKVTLRMLRESVDNPQTNGGRCLQHPSCSSAISR